MKSKIIQAPVCIETIRVADKKSAFRVSVPDRWFVRLLVGTAIVREDMFEDKAQADDLVSRLKSGIGGF